MNESAPFVHRLQVRFRDCDPLGHVNNAVYLTYLEQTRFAQWRALWGFGSDDPPPDMPGVIMARAEIDYRAQVRHGEQIEIRMRVSKIGRTSFTYGYEIVDGEGKVVANASTVQVMYDYREGRPVPIPAHLRQLLEGAMSR